MVVLHDLCHRVSLLLYLFDIHVPQRGRLAAPFDLHPAPASTLCDVAAPQIPIYHPSISECIASTSNDHNFINSSSTLSKLTSIDSNWATLAVNIPDFSRYVRPGSTKGNYIQLPFLPIAFTLCGVLGIVTTSASHVIFGTYYWNPLDILEQWAKHYGSGGRAGAFFCAVAWYVAQVGTNITANSISAANDLTVLFPKYVNIRRGCIIAAVVGGWVLVPWKILESADTFLDFMGGYSIFLAPIAGIMVADYWLIKRQRLDLPALYDPHGRYRYWYGINWQGMVAFVLGMSPNLPGLAHSITPKASPVSAGAQHIYDFGWLYGFTSSIFIYTVLNLIWPWKAALVKESVMDVLEGRPGVLEGSDSDSAKGGKGGEAYGSATVEVGEKGL